MSRFVFACLCVLGFASAASAQEQIYSKPTYYVESSPSVASNSSAQGVAELQARCGQCKHFGGNTGMMEGVGFSTRSPEDAVRRCCFYGRIRISDQGVARGRNGWYACIRGK
jgi:hypothetical protein